MYTNLELIRSFCFVSFFLLLIQGCVPYHCIFFVSQMNYPINLFFLVKNISYWEHKSKELGVSFLETKQIKIVGRESKQILYVLHNPFIGYVRTSNFFNTFIASVFPPLSLRLWWSNVSSFDLLKNCYFVAGRIEQLAIKTNGWRK